jgi:hypothetical protein
VLSNAPLENSGRPVQDPEAAAWRDTVTIQNIITARDIIPARDITTTVVFCHDRL